MNAWAIVVGINTYPVDTALAELQGAVTDAADFADWLLDPGGGNVAHDHLYFWTHPAPVNPGPHLNCFMMNPTQWPKVGPLFDRAPEAMEIIRCVPTLAKQAVDDNADRLYVFFTGHGAQRKADKIYDEDPQNCFIAGDYVPELAAGGLVGMDNLRRFLQVAGTPELVIFFDCCRSRLPLKVGNPTVPYNLQPSNGLFRRLGVALASQPGAVAREVTMINSGETRGAFSKLVIGALREHRVNGRLTLKDLEDFVYAGIGDLTKPDTQVPDFDEKPRPPALVLAEGPAAQSLMPLKVSFQLLAIGSLFEISDANANLVQTSHVVAGQNIFMLPVGSYSIENPAAVGGQRVLTAFNHVGPEGSNVTV